LPKLRPTGQHPTVGFSQSTLLGFPLFVTMALGLRLFWQFSQKAMYSTFGRIWRVFVGYLIVIMLLAFSLQVVIGIFTAQRNIAEKGGGATQEVFEKMNN
jgi:hypothetical protein